MTEFQIVAAYAGGLPILAAISLLAAWYYDKKHKQ